MDEKFNKYAKVEQLTKMFISCGEEKGLIVKDPYGRIISKTIVAIHQQKKNHATACLLTFSELSSRIIKRAL